MIITSIHQTHEQIILWLYEKFIQYICFHFIKDNCCLDSITLWYVDITLNVYIHNQECTFSLLVGQRTIDHKYMSKHEHMSLSETYLTNQTQTGPCPHKVEILL